MSDQDPIEREALPDHIDFQYHWEQSQDSDEDSLDLGLRFLVGLLAIGIAYLIPNVLDLIIYAYTFGAAGLFFPMLGLLFWRRTTATGAFWSMMLGGSSAVIWAVAGEPWGFASSYAGWLVALPALVVISLLTDHSPDENTELFFERRSS